MLVCEGRHCEIVSGVSVPRGGYSNTGVRTPSPAPVARHTYDPPLAPWLDRSDPDWTAYPDTRYRSYRGVHVHHTGCGHHYVPVYTGSVYDGHYRRGHRHHYRHGHRGHARRGYGLRHRRHGSRYGYGHRGYGYGYGHRGYRSSIEVRPNRSHPDLPSRSHRTGRPGRGRR